jgi:hypothetical protein
MDTLPVELIEKIYSYLREKDVISLSLTSKRNREILINSNLKDLIKVDEYNYHIFLSNEHHLKLPEKIFGICTSSACTSLKDAIEYDLISKKEKKYFKDYDEDEILYWEVKYLYSDRDWILNSIWISQDIDGFISHQKYNGSSAFAMMCCSWIEDEDEDEE